MGVALVEPLQQILEGLERADLSVHPIGLAQGIAHAGVDGGRRHLHEPTSRCTGESLHALIPILHDGINVRCPVQLQMLRVPNGESQGCCRNETIDFMKVNDAIARARAHSPFLAMQLELRPQVAAMLAGEGLDAALAAAESDAAEVM